MTVTVTFFAIFNILTLDNIAVNQAASHMVGDLPTCDSHCFNYIVIQTALISHPDIHHLGLFIQPVLKLFICWECKIALTGNNIGQHLHMIHHDIPGIHVNTAKINQIVAQYDILQHMPIIKGPIPEVDGLHLLQDHVQCPECDCIYARDSLRMHYCRQHPSMQNCQANSLPGIFAQRLNQGSHKQLFEVIPHPTPNIPLATLSSCEIIKNLRSGQNDLIEEYYPKEVDARAVSPWLLSTGWHLHVTSYDTQALCKLAAIPKNEERLDKLSNATHGLFQEAYRIMTVTNTLTLQKINTSDPIKDG